ncbi:fatty acid desaturase [uncultured Tateyamaria sp.]|uniref:fatty acid desaturase n=1 Tax=uncultured Tateyamaria sp. TaxID=455651 RepID=UPI00262F9F0F|nr:fatty acid desaturase [uncultured Tateyamaria sp.]
MPSHRSSRRLPFDRPLQVEWITLGLCAAVSGLWLSAVFVLPGLWAWAALVFALVLHASLSHEVLHGHPFPSRRLSEALVLVSPGLFVPYLRFRDTHLAHHQDANLTDPYDDPETNYVDPVVWARMPRALRAVLKLNNTLAGRMLVGPVVAQVSFMRDDWQAIRAGDRQALKGWLVHVPGVVLILAAVWASPMPVWMYLTASYVSVSVLKIRTFLEHQAHAQARGRTVIVEDRGPLAFLFLNNNFHVVHHMHPRVPWYRLPALYRANRDRYLSCNEGYRYGSYGEVFKRHFLQAKDPVPHPLWSSDR